MCGRAIKFLRVDALYLRENYLLKLRVSGKFLIFYFMWKLRTFPATARNFHSFRCTYNSQLPLLLREATKLRNETNSTEWWGDVWATHGRNWSKTASASLRMGRKPIIARRGELLEARLPYKYGEPESNFQSFTGFNPIVYFDPEELCQTIPANCYSHRWPKSLPPFLWSAVTF